MVILGKSDNIIYIYIYIYRYEEEIYIYIFFWLWYVIYFGWLIQQGPFPGGSTYLSNMNFFFFPFLFFSFFLSLAIPPFQSLKVGTS